MTATVRFALDTAIACPYNDGTWFMTTAHSYERSQGSNMIASQHSSPHSARPRNRFLLLAAVCSAAATAATGCSSATSGFKPMFADNSTAGWQEVASNGAWSFENGILKCNGKKKDYAWLSTDRKYGDFELSLEWRIGPRANTGVFCRVPQREGRASMTGFEVQIADDATAKAPTEFTGSIFSRLANETKIPNLLGEWHHYVITCKGTKVHITCDGKTIQDFDMATIPSMQKVPSEGHIGLQNHGTPAEFRDVSIKEIPKR